jgi:hypothetical protein
MSRYVGSIVASVVLTIVVADGVAGIGTMLMLSTVALGVALLTASRLPNTTAASPEPAIVG